MTLPTSNPMYWAKKHNRTYITPEDVSTAVDEGADWSDLQTTVLFTISSGKCEDPGLCAFIALSRRAPPVSELTKPKKKKKPTASDYIDHCLREKAKKNRCSPKKSPSKKST